MYMFPDVFLRREGEREAEREGAGEEERGRNAGRKWLLLRTVPWSRESGAAGKHVILVEYLSRAVR